MCETDSKLGQTVRKLPQRFSNEGFRAVCRICDDRPSKLPNRGLLFNR